MEINFLPIYECDDCGLTAEIEIKYFNGESALRLCKICFQELTTKSVGFSDFQEYVKELTEQNDVK